LNLREADGRERTVRVAFAGSNDQAFRSAGRWLLDQGATRDASPAGQRAWLAANPQRAQEFAWANPRVVFFSEQAADESGPRGAQGVRLSAGRSLAVDRASIPLGSLLWMSTAGTLNTQRLVLAQDTGSAIQGAVRADFFAGTGDAALALAGRIRQGLQLWVLMPRNP
jgi:membrane-bound lytic murein transglycosylase A